jgi:hypothetical protein
VQADLNRNSSPFQLMNNYARAVVASIYPDSCRSKFGTICHAHELEHHMQGRSNVNDLSIADGINV